MIEIDKEYVFDVGTLHTGNEARLFLENTIPVHELPKNSGWRFKCIREVILNGRGLELPPILIFIDQHQAKTGCHRHHAYLEIREHGVDCALPVFLVGPEQKMEFFRAIGGYGEWDTLYVLQEKFHRWLVKKGVYTKRILNRRLKDVKKC